ncbi:hypothetical protein [Glutamicibacter halophytocola]|uniref:hypothetical protein n=1 Tax=Glutamicibacter halophytocola TaxID=1933880 RepID=UPI001C96BBEA|nr:hypothetical protein [Glutamicibacter halophytocola]
MAWVDEELKSFIGTEHELNDLTSLATVLLPKSAQSATWYTRLYPSSGFEERLEDTNDLKSIILDGNGAIKHLNSLENPIIFCIIDRSISDDTGAEVINQLRNTRGTPLSLADDLLWSPPIGIEALAFTVPL